jgi:REP element-mobilizing transposase RayT
MANSYTRLYVQLVFSPSGRENILPVKHKEELHKYCTGIIQNRKHKLLAINNLKDHIHIFIGYNQGQLLPDLVRDIKSSSSKFINENSWLPVRFQWQEGYGGFSYSHSDVEKS